MDIERRLAHAGFTLTRDYPVPVEAVWQAFADGEQKRSWMGGSDEFEPRAWAFDFRVGGTDVDEAKFHGGPVSRYEGRYHDIVEHSRIVTTYDMWLDGVHMSTSIASFEFEVIPTGTRLTHTEHGAFFDQFWADGANREQGSRGLHEALGRYLTQLGRWSSTTATN